MIYFFIFLLIWFAYWSAEAGASLPWSKMWQDKTSWASEVPEFVIALSIGSIGIWGFEKLFGFPILWGIAGWLLFLVIAYAGKQSGTWAYLNWEGHTKDSNGDGVIDDKDGRQSTMREFNDMLAGLFSYKLGDEGYSWIWAFTKGFITTLPLFSLGAIFQPLWREAMSHAKGRLPGDPNMYMELGDGLAYASAAITFISIVGLLS